MMGLQVRRHPSLMWVVWVLGVALTLAACGDDARAPRGGDDERDDHTLFDPHSLYDGGALLVSPSTIVFDVMEIGQPVHQEVAFTNRGVDGLVVFRLGAQGGRARDVDLAGVDLPMGIGVGETQSVTLEYLPQSCDPSEATLRVFWSNKDSSRLDVPIETTGLLGELTVLPEAVRFGRLGAFNRGVAGVAVTNMGRCPLMIERMTIQGSDSFRLSTPGDDGVPLRLDYPVTITMDQPLAFNVTYFSEVDIPENAQLIIEEANQDEPMVVELSANRRECPIAVAEATVVGREMDPTDDLLAVPLDTIQLSGAQSFDPDGEVTTYEWTVVERPEGSTAELSPGTDSVEPDFFLDLAGDYTFQLDVTDLDEMTSCEAAYVHVLAVPDEDIHVQLVWHTPGDPDEGDGRGTDLDLHLLRQPGSWDAEPWDCHWKNMEPDWGTDGPGDDPSLDIDDVDEFGPENINLDRPAPGTTYVIGVYYYSDDGMGASYATVRVFFDGVEVFEVADRELERTSAFWEVGEFTWPAASIETLGRIYPFGFP